MDIGFLAGYGCLLLLMISRVRSLWIFQWISFQFSHSSLVVRIRRTNLGSDFSKCPATLTARSARSLFSIFGRARLTIFLCIDHQASFDQADFRFSRLPTILISLSGVTLPLHSPVTLPLHVSLYSLNLHEARLAAPPIVPGI